MKRRSNGQSLVEFSLCFIVFIMVVFAAVDFARYMFLRHNITTVTQEAVRAGITAQRLMRDIGDGSGVSQQNRERSIVIRAIEYGRAIGGLDLGTVNPYSPRNITVEHVPSDDSYASQNLEDLPWQAGPGGYDALLRVTIRQDFQWLTPFMKWLTGGTPLSEVRASTLERNRGDEDEFADP